jgi:hypothetical protein
LGLVLATGASAGFAQDADLADEAVPASEWMERQVRSVERTLYGAQFRSTLGISAQLRDHPVATNDQKVRLELAHATAAIALGEIEAGDESLRRILELEPGFALTDKDSPKLRRALQNLRKVEP